jgi:hypothetical protein
VWRRCARRQSADGRTLACWRSAYAYLRLSFDRGRTVVGALYFFGSHIVRFVCHLVPSFLVLSALCSSTQWLHTRHNLSCKIGARVSAMSRSAQSFIATSVARARSQALARNQPRAWQATQVAPMRPCLLQHRVSALRHFERISWQRCANWRCVRERRRLLARVMEALLACGRHVHPHQRAAIQMQSIHAKRQERAHSRRRGRTASRPSRECARGGTLLRLFCVSRFGGRSPWHGIGAG